MGTSARSRFSGYAVVVLALALLGGLYTAFAAPRTKAEDPANQSIAVKEGRQLYLQGCSTCHGLNNQGGAGGPSLIGVGASAVVFQVESGRMPLARGAAQAERKPAKYDRTQTDQLAAYVQSLGGGPEVPAGTLDDGELALGGDLFRTNCSSCHNFAGVGGALTRAKYAPALTEASARVIYTAMQTGPENMPRFSDNTLSPTEKRAITKYVLYTTQEAKNPGGAGLGRYGPVPEGLVVFLVGMGLLILTTLWIGARA
ncbi:MAG TPA: c-type cytochrome [Mycobacteriales bacterium]|nr:c-type cytochrome [Mycobacteriales bacterium]